MVVSYGRRGGRGLISHVSERPLAEGGGFRPLAQGGTGLRGHRRLSALAGLTFPKRIRFPAKVQVTHAGAGREEAGVTLIGLSCSQGRPGQVWRWWQSSAWEQTPAQARPAPYARRACSFESGHWQAVQLGTRVKLLCFLIHGPGMHLQTRFYLRSHFCFF